MTRFSLIGSGVRSPYPFFLLKKALKRVFRGKFLVGLKRLYQRRQM
jgi:hypothetical protein